MITTLIFYEKYGLLGIGTVIHKNFHGESMKSLKTDFAFIKFSTISIEDLQNDSFAVNPFEGGHVPICDVKPLLKGDGIANWDYKRINDWTPLKSNTFWQNLAKYQYKYIGKVNIENDSLLIENEKFKKKLSGIDLDIYAWHWHDIGAEIQSKLLKGHRYHRKKITITTRTIPKCIFKKYILNRNGKYYGDEQLNVIKYRKGQYSSDLPHGSLPVMFLCFLTNLSNSFEITNSQGITHNIHECHVDYKTKGGKTNFYIYPKWRNPGSTHWQTIFNRKKKKTTEKTHTQNKP